MAGKRKTRPCGLCQQPTRIHNLLFHSRLEGVEICLNCIKYITDEYVDYYYEHTDGDRSYMLSPRHYQERQEELEEEYQQTLSQQG